MMVANKKAALERKTVVAVASDGTMTLVERIATRRSAIPLKDFADLMGISYCAAWEMTKDGRLPAMRVGNAVRLDPKTTAEWVRQRTSP